MAKYDPNDEDMHWDDEEWLASYRADMEAELDAEGDPSWTEMTQEQKDWSWQAALHLS